MLDSDGHELCWAQAGFLLSVVLLLGSGDAGIVCGELLLQAY